MPYELGVDLGTTYTAAATYRNGSARIVELGNRSAPIPSVVYLTEENEILTGEAANRRAVTNPGRVAREFKRRIGDPTPILLGGSPCSAESLSARLLEWVMGKVTEREGEAPSRVAVTHPANWGPYKLDLLHQAFRMANLDGVHTLTEPEAAAIHYSTLERIEPGMTVGVFDLGGGTFDAAILRKKAHGFDFLGSPEGIERLGGIDFDMAVFEFVRRAPGVGFDSLDVNDPAVLAAAARLQRDCVDAKEALSSDTEAVIPVVLPGNHTEVRINRSEFEQLVRPSLTDSIGAMERAIRSAGITVDEVDVVLLVGGSSRIPLVSQMVHRELGRPVAVDAHPKHSVALGAAWAAANAGGAHLASVTMVTPVATPQEGSPSHAVPSSPPSTERTAPPTPEPASPSLGAGAAAAAETIRRPLSDFIDPASGEHPAADRPAPDFPAPAHPAADRPAPAHPAADRPAPDFPAPAHPAAYSSAPEQPASSGNVPAQPASDRAAPANPPVEHPATEVHGTPADHPVEHPATEVYGSPPVAPGLSGQAEGRSAPPAPEGGGTPPGTGQPFRRSSLPVEAPGTSGTDAVGTRTESAASFASAAPAEKKRSSLPLILIGGLVLLALIAGGAIAATQLGGDDDEPVAAGDTAPDGEADGSSTTEADPDDDGGADDATSTTDEATTTTEASTTTEATTTTEAPFLCEGLCTHIEDVTVEDDGELLIEWTAFNFAPDTNDTHAHFFYDIYEPEQVGLNNATYGVEQGDWVLTDQSPFTTRSTQVSVANAPEGTTAICVVAADSGHGVINPENAECFDLP